MVLFLTNMSYVNQLGSDPLIDLGFNSFVPPIEVAYVVLGIGAAAHIIGIIGLQKIGVNHPCQTFAELLIFSLGYSAGILASLGYN